MQGCIIDCLKCDAVRVFDGPSVSSPLLATMCGREKRMFKSSRKALTVVFTSDKYINKVGFIAQWRFTGDLIISSSGISACI